MFLTRTIFRIASLFDQRVKQLFITFKSCLVDMKSEKSPFIYINSLKPLSMWNVYKNGWELGFPLGDMIESLRWFILPQYSIIE